MLSINWSSQKEQAGGSVIDTKLLFASDNLYYILQSGWIKDHFISPNSTFPLNKDKIVGQTPCQTTKLCGNIMMSPKFIGECWSRVTEISSRVQTDSYLRSKRKKGHHVRSCWGGSILSCRQLCLHVLLWQNGFGHPSEKLAIVQPSGCSTCQCSKLFFCYV